MKIQFDPDLDFQKDAIHSVTCIFEGQEICQTNFTVVPLKYDPQMKLGFLEKNYDLGIGNRLKLHNEDILKNVRNIQLKNGLSPSEALNSMNFTVEMETGTGKTYVYLRTIFELNRLYGFTKFIIVVPSIAIKEGVYKSLQITEDHFHTLYNVSYDFFVYDSQKLDKVRDFAVSDDIQIMIINIDAFRRSFTNLEKEDKANVIHRPNDRMTGWKPIEFIQATTPIVFIDEPQSVDTTNKSKEAIASLNPLCTLRYSATHVDKHHMLYKLDSVDAYERKLVKQIEVAGIEVKEEHNKAYIKLLKVNNKNNEFTAQIELDIQKNGSVSRKLITVSTREGDLFKLSGHRSVYDGYIIEDIYCEKGSEYISFTSRPDIVRLGQAIGDVNPDEYKRLQIRKTIEEHLEKELRLTPKGIKVLSLFFVDRVANYRWYDKNGNPHKGKFAKIFEDEYIRVMHKPKYQTLLKGTEPEISVKDVHDGYFAIDKKKKDSTGAQILIESSGEVGKTQADESAYNLIMQKKEELLSFNSKLKFIFSHSALKEGWDNPNVFQICTLNETRSDTRRRQVIGRGLRIAVNQDGKRVYGFDVNTLTVMANESYESFAKNLQNEMEEEGIKFGVVEKHVFANIVASINDHTTNYLGVESSEHLWNHFKEKKYIDAKGNTQNRLRYDLNEGKIDLPQEFREHTTQIVSVLRKVAGKLNIKNADDKKTIKLKRTVLESSEFNALWNRIKYKTTFRVNFNPEELTRRCSEEIERSLVVGRARLEYTKVVTDIGREGIHTNELRKSISVYETLDYELPDIITYLQNETNVTRRTLVEILKRSGKLADFKNNPQKFIEQVSSIIKHQMQLFIVDGIKYGKIGDGSYYAQELFQENELYGYLSKNMLKSLKSPYDYVVYDSDIEAEFASQLELNNEVKVYAKLPSWFKISTPLGSYNPDWAVLIEVDGQDKLYFVVETKGVLFTDMLRLDERAKIDCGREHFKAVDKDIKFIPVKTYGDLLGKVSECEN